MRPTNREIVSTRGLRKLEDAGWHVFFWPGWGMGFSSDKAVRFGRTRPVPEVIERQATPEALAVAQWPFRLLGAWHLEDLEEWSDVAPDWPSVFELAGHQWDARLVRDGLQAVRLAVAERNPQAPISVGVVRVSSCPEPGAPVQAMVLEAGTWRVCCRPFVDRADLYKPHPSLVGVNEHDRNQSKRDDVHRRATRVARPIPPLEGRHPA